MEPHHHHTSPPGPLRSTHLHLAQDHLVNNTNDQATTTTTDSPTHTALSSSSKQQPGEEDLATFTTTPLRKHAASTAALSSSSSPSPSPASSQQASSPTSPALSSTPLLPRVPGTPPTNPPPRFFTRPYRRPIDHSHHHGSAHGAGYLNSQGSASLGVRSAFKDFIVPAQIILFFSILNALWPTLLRIVTTTIEFLVLVLSSYSACARNSDNCYFLEPLLPDGQEGAYAVTIQWTLRIVFCFLFFGGFAIISKRMEKVWSTLLSNRQRPRSFWSPDNVVSWILSCPGALWSYIERLLPWKISRSFRQSTPTRSRQRHHRKASGLQSDDQYYSSSAKSRANSISSSFRSGYEPRRANGSSCVDTDAISAGSGSESRPRSKKSKKPRVLEESTLREISSMPRSPLHNQSSPTQPAASDSSELPSSTAPSPETATPMDSKTATPTVNNNDVSNTTTTPVAHASGALKSEKSDAGISTAASANSGIVYETADDDDFISTDRRRRRRAKGLKTNLDAHSSETLIKPTPCPQDEKEASSSQSNPSTRSTRSSPVPDAPKAITNTTNKSTSSLSAPTQPTSHPSTTTTTSTSNSQDGHNSQKAAGSQAQHLLPSGNLHQRQESKTRNQHQKSASQTRRKDEAESHSKTQLGPTSTNVSIPPVTTTSTPLDLTPETTFVHPLHALNSTSSIVRLRPLHKRSQSAQLPSVSPWSIPHSSTSAAGSTSGASHSKLAGGSSLNQMTLPVDLTAEHVDHPYTSSSQTSTTAPTTPATLSETDKLETSGAGEYDLFGPSSGWYSPFQSGLDITIESDQEKGRHGSRSVTRPRVNIDAATLQSKSRPTLGPFLPPSSFFESSPRTPRIMPFSQHYREDSGGNFGRAAGSASGSASGTGTGIGMGLTGNEDWSVRTRSSSIAAPMTPLLESDCVDPMDYFGGSRSASSSRRGSVENNLTESLLSGRARMFASSDSSFGSTRLSQSSTSSGQQSVGASGSMNQPSLLGNSPFISPHHFSATISSRIQAAAVAAHSSASNSPVLGGQRTLELPIAIANPTAAISGISTSNSGTASLLSDVGFESTTTANPLLSGLSGAAGSTSASASSPSTAFVNPWESNYPYKSSSHTMSDTFLPFGLGSSSLNNSSTNLLDHQFQADQDRQSSLLRLMNSSGGSAGSSIDLGNGGDMDPRIGSQLHQHQRDDNESEAIRRGFLFPNLAHHTGVGSTPSLPLLSADLSGGSTGGFQPFASVEMSLAAAANQPPPLMQEEPMYDFVELSIPDLSRKPGGGGGVAGLDSLSSIAATGSLSGAGGLSSSSSSSLTGTGAFRATGGVSGGAEGGEKKHRERGARHGRSRSGHHKSASLGSFFLPFPPATTTTSSSSSSSGAASVVGGGDHHHGSPGIQGSSAGVLGFEAPLQSGRHHNHGHSRLGRGSGAGGKDSESRRSRASTGVEQQDIGGGGSHSRGTSRHFDGSNGNSRAKRVPKKDHQQHHQQQSNSHQTQNQNQSQNQNQNQNQNQGQNQNQQQSGVVN
ncbi:hypothetical protein BGX30_003776 [Mortierella sp. GBA39]|nr:hypothetical protein BGX30_003776 [Mortierella sp. GBA39]